MNIIKYKFLKNSIVSVILCVLCSFVCLGQDPGCPPGAECYTFDARMDLQEAMLFNRPDMFFDTGIQAEWLPDNSSIRIDVYSKEEITWSSGIICTNTHTDKIYLFGGEITEPTTSTRKLDPILEDGSTVQVKLFNDWRKKFIGCWSSNRRESLEVLSHNALLYYDKLQELQYQLNGGGFYALSDFNSVNVTIRVSFTGDASFGDILSMSLPAVNETDVYDLLSLGNYTNPCYESASNPGCQAVADWKDVNTLEGKKTMVVAHRGYHGMRGVPENSLAAVQKAYEEKYRYIEVDIRRSKDDYPFIFHDDFLGYATDFNSLNNLDPNSHISSHNLAELQMWKYRTRYWDEVYNSATNSNGKTVNARVGTVASSANVNSLAEIYDYINGKDIMLYLDIKDVPTEENLKTMKECLKLAIEKNVLHQIAVKMIRTNAGAPPDKQLVMPVSKAEELLGSYYSILKDNLNIHIVDYRPHEETAFINDWIGQGNVVGFEFDSNVSGWNTGTKTSFFQAPAFDSKIYNGLSAWEYTKTQNIRTGLWSSGPIDPRGRPGHDPSKWSLGGAMNRKIENSQHYADIRSRFEIQMVVLPEYVTQDRPNIWINYLQAVNQLNSKTFRP
ncbi:MAG: hypothetical protein JXR10_17620 [Cyclobacteriaceae bacterium]